MLDYELFLTPRPDCRGMSPYIKADYRTPRRPTYRLLVALVREKRGHTAVIEDTLDLRKRGLQRVPFWSRGWAPWALGGARAGLPGGRGARCYGLMRGNASKGGDNATALIWRTLLIAEKAFRRLNARELLKDVYEGTVYLNGLAVPEQSLDKAV
jgi:hypothetical protein